MLEHSASAWAVVADVGTSTHALSEGQTRWEQSAALYTEMSVSEPQP